MNFSRGPFGMSILLAAPEKAGFIDEQKSIRSAISWLVCSGPTGSTHVPTARPAFLKFFMLSILF